jgi:hypothetical protein
MSDDRDYDVCGHVVGAVMMQGLGAGGTCLRDLQELHEQAALAAGGAAATKPI